MSPLRRILAVDLSIGLLRAESLNLELKDIKKHDLHPQVIPRELPERLDFLVITDMTTNSHIVLKSRSTNVPMGVVIEGDLDVTMRRIEGYYTKEVEEGICTLLTQSVKQ